MEFSSEKSKEKINKIKLIDDKLILFHDCNDALNLRLVIIMMMMILFIVKYHIYKSSAEMYYFSLLFYVKIAADLI